jgi:probable rRNA maturation factor
MLELTVQNEIEQSLVNLIDIDEDTWSEYFQIWIAQPDLGLPAASDYEVTLRLTDDAEIQSLNAQYRQIDRPTDVLAFAALEDEIVLPAEMHSLPLYLGDIIISIETAQRQAAIQKHSLAIELLWLASHGFLHLLGWDHPDDQSLNEMLACQDLLLGTINVVIETQTTGETQTIGDTKL